MHQDHVTDDDIRWAGVFSASQQIRFCGQGIHTHHPWLLCRVFRQLTLFVKNNNDNSTLRVFFILGLLCTDDRNKRRFIALKGESGDDTMVIALLSIVLALGAPCDCFLTEKTLMFGAFTNNIQVFIDGTNCSFDLPQYTSWPTIYSVEIPSMARIVALSVQAKSIAWPSALIAFVANTSVVSGYSWKCKKDSVPGLLWTQPSFNDSLWNPGPVANSDLVDLLMTLFGEHRCTVCDPTASWLGYINFFYPIKFYCRVHLPVEEVPTTRALQTVTFRAQTDAPELAFLLADRGVAVSSPPLSLCVRNTRSRISCARLCVRQKAYCVGFQYGGSDNVCCPLDDFVLTNALRSPAIGVDIWLRAS